MIGRPREVAALLAVRRFEELGLLTRPRRRAGLVVTLERHDPMLCLRAEIGERISSIARTPEDGSAGGQGARGARTVPLRGQSLSRYQTRAHRRGGAAELCRLLCYGSSERDRGTARRIADRKRPGFSVVSPTTKILSSDQVPSRCRSEPGSSHAASRCGRRCASGSSVSQPGSRHQVGELGKVSGECLPKRRHDHARRYPNAPDHAPIVA